MSVPDVCSLLEPLVIIRRAGCLVDELPSAFLEAARQVSQGQTTQAIATLNNMVPARPDVAFGWIIAVTAHCRQGNFKTARDVAERGLQQVGKNTYLLDGLGVALFGLKDYANAQRSFLHAIQADAHHANAFLNLANVFLSQKRPDAAFETLQHGKNQNPDNAEIKRLLLKLDPAWIQPVLAGKLRLRMLAPSDEDFLVRSCADQAFMNGYHRFVAHRQSRQRIRSSLEQNPRLRVLKQKSVHWLVELADHPEQENPDYREVGLATLAGIEIWPQRAEVLIGFPDKAHRGRGTPLAATLLILDFAFNRIGFHKLTSIVYDDNPYSQRNSLALGFRQEGFRSSHLRDLQTGQWLGIYDNGLLQSDFRNNARIGRLSERLVGRDITRPGAGKKVFDEGFSLPSNFSHL